MNHKKELLRGLWVVFDKLWGLRCWGGGSWFEFGSASKPARFKRTMPKQPTHANTPLGHRAYG